MPSPPSLSVRTVAIDAPDGITLHADIYQPATVEHERVAVLMLHGGAWRFGDRSMMRIRAEALSAHGFVVVAADYRLLGDAPWPAPLVDSRAWIRWIRANASELGVSASRVAALGCSAGGHLALLCGSTAHNDAEPDDIPPSAIVAMYPPTDLPTESQVMLLGEDPDPVSAHQASPIHHVASDFPPTMFVHGLADQMVPFASSQHMHQALLDVGAASELHLFDGQIHEFEAAPTYAAVVQHLVAVFLKRLLEDPEAFEAEQQAHNPLAAGPPPGVR